MKVTAIVVAYNSGLFLSDCVRGLLGTPVEQVVVVDNSGTANADLTGEVIAADRLLMVSPGANLGYAGGNNAGVICAPDAEAYLVVNPDVRIDSLAVSRMTDELQRRPGLGAVAPSLVSPGGSVSGTYWTPGVGPIVMDFLTRGATSRRRYCREGAERAWLSGACVMVRGAALRALEGFDEDLFFCEDVDLGVRLSAAGCELALLKEVAAVHVGGHSYASGFSVYWARRSRLLFAHKHLGVVGERVIRVVVLLDCALRLFVEWRPSRRDRRVGLRRAMSDAWTRGYLNSSEFGTAYRTWVTHERE